MSRKNTPSDLIRRADILENDCWIWTGEKVPQGYGMVNYCGKHWRVHRLAYFIKYGPFDFSLDVLHKCDTPACFNPEHLFLGTDKDNVHDCMDKGRRCDFRGAKSPLAKLSWEQVEEIRLICQSGEMGQRDIAKLYQVDQSVIKNINKGYSYREEWK